MRPLYSLAASEHLGPSFHNYSVVAASLQKWRVYNSTKNKTTTIKLIDVLGRIVYTNIAKINDGRNTIEINTTNVSKGIYSLELTTDKATETKRGVIE